MSGRRALNPPEMVEAAAAVAALVASRILLAVTSSKNALRLMGAFSNRPNRSSTTDPERIAHLARGVNQRSHLRFTCLPLSLAIWARLRRHGYAAELRIGAPLTAPRSEPFEAHAWVELDGRPVGEEADLLDRYTVLGDPVTGRR